VTSLKESRFGSITHSHANDAGARFVTSFVETHLICLDTRSVVYYKPSPVFTDASANLEEEKLRHEARFPSAPKSSGLRIDAAMPFTGSQLGVLVPLCFPLKFTWCAGTCLLAQESVPC
jgi:hypothetical protein